MFSAGVRDFKLLFPNITINVNSNSPQVFNNNPYLDTSLSQGDGVEFYQVGYPAICSVNNTNVHFTQMFLLDMIAISDITYPLPISIGQFCAAFANGEVGDPCLSRPDKNPAAREPFIELAKTYHNFGKNFSRQRGDIHLSEEEKKTNIMKDIYGIYHYWVIAPGGKRDCTAKIWDWRKFQKVIDYYHGLITFVTIGKSDLLIEQLKGIINLTDKFNDNLRGLFSLVYHSAGCVSGPSALMHIAAAIPPRIDNERKPCVSIFGGREPAGWSWYTNHQILHTNGAFTCSQSGGCWKARVYPLQKDPQHNKNLCSKAIDVDGKTIQACMASILTKDVIRAIGKYYDGDIYKLKPEQPVGVLPGVKNDITMVESNKILPELSVIRPIVTTSKSNEKIIEEVLDGIINNSKSINLLGNLNSRGGGEQSLCTIAGLLEKAGWKVFLYPISTVNEKYYNLNINIINESFETMARVMKPGIPLLFYANDSTHKFAEGAQEIVKKSSEVIIGVNYINKPLPTTNWLANSGKVKAFIFQNKEKKAEFIRDQIGFDKTQKITLHGAIDLNKFIQVCPPQRAKNEPMVILKHCTPDWRKWITKESEGKGDKIHIWQKYFKKDRDCLFYAKLLKEFKNIRFEFMEAHSELSTHFENEPRMVFHKWDTLSVEEFLSRGHLFLYRTSNLWRDQYPRVVAEALAAGLPVISEPRDGTKDRIRHGDTGFYATHYDEYALHIKTLLRKEDLRHKMGMYASDWARLNLDPTAWVNIIESLTNTSIVQG